MNYSLFILPRAAKELEDLPSETYNRIRDSIRRLAQDPRPKGSIKLSGRDGWRIRVGDYRVVYEIQDSDRIVTILNIGHRRDIYR